MDTPDNLDKKEKPSYIVAKSVKAVFKAAKRQVSKEYLLHLDGYLYKKIAADIEEGHNTKRF